MIENLIAKLFPNNPYGIIPIILIGAFANSTYQWQQARKTALRFGFLDYCIATFLAMFAGNVTYHIGLSIGYAGSTLISFTSFGAFGGVIALNKLYDKYIDVRYGRYGQYGRKSKDDE